MASSRAQLDRSRNLSDGYCWTLATRKCCGNQWRSSEDLLSDGVPSRAVASNDNIRAARINALVDLATLCFAHRRPHRLFASRVPRPWARTSKGSQASQEDLQFYAERIIAGTSVPRQHSTGPPAPCSKLMLLVALNALLANAAHGDWRCGLTSIFRCA